MGAWRIGASLELIPKQSTRQRPEVHIYVYKTAQCIARIGVNDMHDLCGQRKTTRYLTMLYLSTDLTMMMMTII